MLSKTAMCDRLERSSLQAALAKARREVVPVAPDHPVWQAAKRLFPEVLDGLIRAELIDLGQLRTWAKTDARQSVRAA